MIVAYYSAATGRLCVISRLAANEQPRPTIKGEASMVIDQPTYDAWLQQWQGGGDQDPIQALISQKTGLVPTDDRYVIVQNGVVVDWIGQADPAMGHLDGIAAKYPGAQIIKSATALIAATYDGANFVNPPAPVPVIKGVIVGS